MASVSLDKMKLEAILNKPEAHKVIHGKVKEIEHAAIEIYESQTVHYPDTDGIRYEESFEIDNDGKQFFLTNTDPVAFWVEFGAHAGGKTPVLGYAPMRRAIDVVASKDL